MLSKDLNKESKSLLKKPIMLGKPQHIQRQLPKKNRYLQIRHSQTKSKLSQPKQLHYSIHAAMSKRMNNSSKKKSLAKHCGKKKIFPFQKSLILESKEFRELLTLQNEYQMCLKHQSKNINWFIPEQQLNRHCFSTFSDFLKEEYFEDVNNIMINFLHFVCQRRIVRDEEFNYLYEGMVIKFPEKQYQIKEILTQVLNVLES